MDQVNLSVDDTKKLLQYDAKFLIHFFLGDLLTADVPDLHPELFNLMVRLDILQLILAVPRGHAKTTIAKLACIYYYLFTDFSYVLYMSNTASVSIPAVNDIIGFMESDNFKAVYGEIEFLTKQEGKGIYRFKLPNGKICILKAFSAGQQVRGTNIHNTRPQLIVVDDLEDNDNIATKELFDKLKRWFYGPFKKCIDKFNNKWIWIGNLISEQSMLAENLKSEFWHSRLYGCIKDDGTPLWEGLWSLEALKQDYAEYEEAAMADVWFAEMMNMPMAGVDGVIQASDITYAPRMEMNDHKIGFITVDLAHSIETWAHETVVAVHMYNEEFEFWQIVQTNGYKGMDPVKLFPIVMQAAQDWGIYVVGIENVAYQATVQPIWEHFCLIDNIQGMTFVGIPARSQKFARIITWAGLLKTGEYRLTQGDFAVTQQLLAFNPKKKENVDDIIDACAHGVWMIRFQTYEIFNQRFKDKNQDSNLQSSYQISKF